MKKILISLIVLLGMINLISAFNSTTFNNSLYTENLTIFNNLTYSCIGNCNDVNKIFDSDFSTGSNDGGNEIYTNITNEYITVKWFGGDIEVPTLSCYNGNWKEIGTASLSKTSTNVYKIPSDCILNKTQIKLYTGTGNMNLPIVYELNTEPVRYLNVSSNTYLTNSFINLTGYNLIYNTTISSWCFQESVNISNQTGKDGPCSLNYSGSANYLGSYVNPSQPFNNSIDGNYSTYTSSINTTGNDAIYFNYIKPPYANNNSIWAIADYFNYWNLTLPSSCWNYANQLNLRAIFIAGTTSWECYNGGGWSVLRVSPSFMIVYEEAMYWNVNLPITSSPNNISILNPSNIFNNPGNLTSIKTTNLANQIDSYLSTCSYLNGFCNVPFIFHSDTAGVVQYSNLIFNNTGYLDNGQVYSNSTYETSNEQFILNISYDNYFYQSSSAGLVYNGTFYSAAYTNTNQNYIFTTNVTIPLINQTNETKSFYWLLNLTNSTGTYQYSTSSVNQTVKQINLSSCSGSTNILAVNSTLYDQDTLTRLFNWNFKASFNYYIGTGTIYRNISFNNLLINESNICINQNTTFKLNGSIEYSLNSTYQTSSYYLVNSQISNSTTNLSLLLLPSTSTTVFIVKLLDQYSMPIPGYYINILRYYPGLNVFNTVQSIKTDANGQSVAFIEINDIKYKFQVLDTNGTVIYTTDESVITPQSSPYTITISIQSPVSNVLNYNRNITGVTYTIDFDKTTKIVTYAFADTNSSFTLSELLVYKTTGNSQTLVCDLNITTPNGVSTCNLSNYSSGSFKVVAYIYRNSIQYYVDNIIFDISNISFGGLGIFGGICVLIVCGFLFAYNGTAGVISLNIGIIGINLLGWIDFGWIVVTAIVSISIVILIVMERD